MLDSSEPLLQKNVKKSNFYYMGFFIIAILAVASFSAFQQSASVIDLEEEPVGPPEHAFRITNQPVVVASSKFSSNQIKGRCPDEAKIVETKKSTLDDCKAKVWTQVKGELIVGVSFQTGDLQECKMYKECQGELASKSSKWVTFKAISTCSGAVFNKAAQDCLNNGKKGTLTTCLQPSTADTYETTNYDEFIIRVQTMMTQLPHVDNGVCSFHAVSYKIDGIEGFPFAINLNMKYKPVPNSGLNGQSRWRETTPVTASLYIIFKKQSAGYTTTNDWTLMPLGGENKKNLGAYYKPDAPDMILTLEKIKEAIVLNDKTLYTAYVAFMFAESLRFHHIQQLSSIVINGAVQQKHKSNDMIEAFKTGGSIWMKELKCMIWFWGIMSAVVPDYSSGEQKWVTPQDGSKVMGMDNMIVEAIHSNAELMQHAPKECSAEYGFIGFMKWVEFAHTQCRLSSSGSKCNKPMFPEERTEMTKQLYEIPKSLLPDVLETIKIYKEKQEFLMTSDRSWNPGLLMGTFNDIKKNKQTKVAPVPSMSDPPIKLERSQSQRSSVEGQ